MMIPCDTVLVYDTDQDALFEIDEMLHDQVWISARVYHKVPQSSQEGTSLYEVFIFEWDPKTNQETSRFGKRFPNLEEAKLWAIEETKKSH